jgi:D-lactate dehydrogenase
LDKLITTIAPAWDSSQIIESGPNGEIGKRLRTILRSGRVLDRAIDRIAFSSDASFYSLVPQAIAQPATLEEIGALFRFSRTQKVPLVFRAGGTSLSGQAITNGVLIDISRYWRMSEVQDGGRSIRVQPGVIGQVANDSLKPYGAKIGPDPASISVARVGGILSNNASGMCCGVTHNAYHTLRSMKVMLPSGTVIDSGQHHCELRLRQLEPTLCSGLLELKTRIQRDNALAERIWAKYQMKNTTGYSLNAFLDFDTPAQILSHLMIGAEGTLGFIAEAVLETIPDMPLKYTGLLVFSSIHSACGAIVPLREAGVPQSS